MTADDGWPKEGEATATCSYGSAPLVFVNLAPETLVFYIHPDTGLVLYPSGTVHNTVIGFIAANRILDTTILPPLSGL